MTLQRMNVMKKITSNHDSYFHQSHHDLVDFEKSLTELNNNVRNDLEDFKRCRSIRTVHWKLFARDDGKTTGVLPKKESKTVSQEPQSKTDFEKSITKFLDGQRVTNMTEPPPPPSAHIELVNVVFTGSGKSDDHLKILKDPPPPTIVNNKIKKDKPIKTSKKGYHVNEQSYVSIPSLWMCIDGFVAFSGAMVLVENYMSGTVIRYFSFGRHLDELQVAWAHLEKKRTRLRTNTKTLKDLCSQSLETASQAKHDAVIPHQVTVNTIELLKGNNVVPLRSDTIRLVQNGCSFHRLRSEDLNQHLKDFLKLVDLLDLEVVPMTLSIAWKIPNKPSLNTHPRISMKREDRQRRSGPHRKAKTVKRFLHTRYEKGRRTPLLIGRGFLATANAVIDCRMAKIAVREGITRSILGVKGIDLDGIGAKSLYYAREDFVDYHLPREWEISRDVELNPFKDTLVFKRMVEFLGVVPINLKCNMWESEDLIEKPID
uniref:MAK10-like protein n=1 Tax=Tanacetum cinerariifolium TaxID=118510 RepID=A0A6L2LXG4_TANCI|nr:MAK10-like protein [Tanacetum cinerariifolium]